MGSWALPLFLFCLWNCLSGEPQPEKCSWALGSAGGLHQQGECRFLREPPSTPGVVGSKGARWPGCLQRHAAAPRVQGGHLGHRCTGTASWQVHRLMCAWPLLCCNCCLLPKKPLLKMSPDFLHSFLYYYLFLRHPLHRQINFGHP